MSHTPGEKKNAFQRFWKQNSVNLLAGLVVTMIICVAAGIKQLVFALPAWILIGLIFWCVRLYLLFRRWQWEDQKNQSDEQ